MRIVLMLLTVLTLVGCTSDKVVSQESQKLAASLVTVAADLQRDSDAYLARFQADKELELAATKQTTLDVLQQQGKLTPEARKKVDSVFADRSAELKKNLAAAKAAYAVRVEFLQSAAKLTTAIDAYHTQRNTAFWKALGDGAADGVKSQAKPVWAKVEQMTKAPLGQ